MPSYGATPAGFVVKPLANILADMQAQILANVDPQFNLSPATPDGQILGIVAAAAASNWELLQICFNQFNREDVEGAGLDNLGDLIGVPREDATFAQIYLSLVFGASAPATTLAVGALVVSVAGNAALTFQNAAPVVLTGGAQSFPAVLFQAQTSGPTPTINPGTLTVIAQPVTGWTSVTNGANALSQVGTTAELDDAYGPRQAQDVAAEGSCSAAATAAALNELGAAQTPPVNLSATVLENTGNISATIAGVVMPPHTYCPVIYDGGTGWATGSTNGIPNASLIAAVIYANKPGGITSYGTTSYTIQDPILGAKTVSWILPTQVPLYFAITVTPRPNVASFAQLVIAIQQALVQAAVAVTPASGVPPFGQLVPGAPAVGAQFEAVIMGVSGVFDVKALAFDVVASPTNTSPLTAPSSEVYTVAQGTDAANILVIQGSYP